MVKVFGNIYDWIVDHFLTVMIGITVVMIGLICYLTLAVNEECEAKGGVMEGNGHYYSTVVMVDKTAVTQIHEEMACTK